MPETQTAKAERYIAEQRVVKVNELPDGGSIWRIDGDGGTYRIILDPEGVEWTCSCPAGLKGHQDCVHAFSVLTVLGLEPPEPPEVVHLDTPIIDVGLGVFNDPANHDAVEGERLVDETADIVEFLEEPQRTIATLEAPTSVTEAPVTWRVIETIQHSEAVPKTLRGKPEAILAAMLLGRDWALGPFEALRVIDVIEGTLSPSAEAVAQVVPACWPHPRSPPGRHRRRSAHRETG